MESTKTKKTTKGSLGPSAFARRVVAFFGFFFFFFWFLVNPLSQVSLTVVHSRNHRQTYRWWIVAMRDRA